MFHRVTVDMLGLVAIRVCLLHCDMDGGGRIKHIAQELSKRQSFPLVRNEA